MAIHIREHREPGYFWIDNEFLDRYGPKLGVYGVSVYAVLARYVYDRGQCALSVRQIATILNVGKSTVDRTLLLLTEHGLIEVEKPPHGSNKPSTITLLNVKKISEQPVPLQVQVEANEEVTEEATCPATGTGCPATGTPCPATGTPIRKEEVFKEDLKKKPSLESYDSRGDSLEKKPKKEPPPKGPKYGCKTRHQAFIEAFESYWKYKNPGVPLSFGAGDGKQLAMFLADNPHLAYQQWRLLLAHRAKSEGVSHTEALRFWIGKAMNYLQSPLDRFGKALSTPQRGSSLPTAPPPVSSAPRETIFDAMERSRKAVLNQEKVN